MKNFKVLFGVSIVAGVALAGCSSKSKSGSVKSVESSNGSQVVAAAGVTQQASPVVAQETPAVTGDPANSLFIEHDLGSNVVQPEDGIYKIVFSSHGAYQRVGTSLRLLGSDGSEVLSEADAQMILAQSYCEMTTSRITESSEFYFSWSGSTRLDQGDEESGIPFVRVNYQGQRVLAEDEQDQQADRVSLSCSVRSPDFASIDQAVANLFTGDVAMTEDFARDIASRVEDLTSPNPEVESAPSSNVSTEAQSQKR